MGVLVIVVGSFVVVRNEQSLSDHGRRRRHLTARRPTLFAKRRSRRTWPRIGRQPGGCGDGGGVIGRPGGRGRIGGWMVALEGFGQQLLAVAGLRAGAGRPGGSGETPCQPRDCSPSGRPRRRAQRGVLDADAGMADQALASIRRLIDIQPDIEPILAGGPAGLSAIAATAPALWRRPTSWPGRTWTVRCSSRCGGAGPLAESLLAWGVEGTIERGAGSFEGHRRLVRRRSGAGRARRPDDPQPDPSGLLWSWRLAVRACDVEAARRAERSLLILAHTQPATPIAHRARPPSSGLHSSRRATRCRLAVGLPVSTIVDGLWSYALGRPRTARARAG